MWGSGLAPQMKMRKPKNAMQNEQPSAFRGTAYGRAAEYGGTAEPCSFCMSSPRVAGPMSSEEGIPKSRVKVILENRARVD